MNTSVATYRVGLLGSGLDLSLAKVIQEREGEEQKVGYQYQVFDTDRSPEIADLPATLAQLRADGYHGTNVTHPFKRSIIAELDALSADAEALGAVNTVVFDGGRAVGHNTDWYGFARSLEVQLAGAKKDRVVQLGAGGAGVAVAHALLECGVAELILLGRDPARTQATTDALRRMHPEASIVPGALGSVGDHLGGVDGVVNATPMGMPAHPGSPVPGELLHPDLWVHDIVYMPLVTELMTLARAAGCRTVGGEHMFVYQAAENFRLFTGIDPDADRMLAHLAQLVRARAQPSTT